MTEELVMEIENLFEAVDDFSLAMKAKLIQKALEGKRGWADLGAKTFIEGEFRLHVDKALNNPENRKDAFTDVANFAMMLWGME